MPSKRGTPTSPLRQAAEAFDDELNSYLHLSEAFQRAPLSSTKHLERVNELLGEIAASEQRLAECGQRLAAAVNEARDRQERQARVTLERVPEVRARMEHVRGLLAQFEALGSEAGALNQTAATLGRAGQQGEAAPGEPAGQLAGARELAAQMHGLSLRAQQLAAAAKQLDFEELGNKAHALHQQLLSAYNKLKLAVVG